tara:strand:+ start:669 stop:1412 length:744 start_codon:yes stop_codon:yes gene_type:complete
LSVSASQIKIKGWAKKVQYLRSVLSDKQEIFDVYDKDFQEVLKIAAGNIRVKQDVDVLQKVMQQHAAKRKSIEEIDKETLPDPEEKNPTKSLYRKIAFATHPDRQGLLDNDEETASKNEELFRRAQNAHSEGDTSDLLMIAHELDIDLLSLGYTMQDLKKLYDNLESSLKVKIKEIEDSYAYVWGESVGNLDLRINLLDAYLRRTGHPPVQKSILKDIIMHHEEDVDKTVNPARKRKVGQRPKKLIR